MTRLAIDSDLADQPERRFRTRDRTCSKCSFLILPITKGIPRYLPKDAVMEKPHSWAISSLSIVGMFREKNKAVLVPLTFYLEAKQKDCKTPLIIYICEIETSVNSNRSFR